MVHGQLIRYFLQGEFSSYGWTTCTQQIRKIKSYLSGATMPKPVICVRLVGSFSFESYIEPETEPDFRA